MAEAYLIFPICDLIGWCCFSIPVTTHQAAQKRLWRLPPYKPILPLLTRRSLALQADFAALDTQVIGISKDSVSSHDKFVAKYQLTVPLLSDESGTVSEAFGVWKEKSMYGKTYMGIERSTFLINGTGQIVCEWRKVKVPGHAETVLQALKEL